MGVKLTITIHDQLPALKSVGLGLVLFAIAGCAHGDAKGEPVQLSSCSIASRPSRSGYLVTYTFRLTNSTKRTVTATRIGFRPWRDAAIPIPDDRTGTVYDDEQQLLPSSSHVVHLRTGVIPGPRRLFPRTPLSCKTVAVLYENGAAWAARRGFALPLTHQHSIL